MEISRAVKIGDSVGTTQTSSSTKVDRSNAAADRFVSCPLCLIGVLFVSIAFCVSAISCRKHIDADIRSTQHAVRENPIRVLPYGIPLLHLSARQKNAIWQFARMPPKEKATVSDCLHFLRLQSLKPEHCDDVAVKSELQPIYSVFQDGARGRDFLGEPAFLAVRYGIRMTTDRGSRADEAHRDQGLATFAELGIPLSWQLDLDGRKCVLREAIQECIANFYLKQKELAWTTIALACYLPPTRSWGNRFGENFTFDDIVVELCKRPFREQCCCGTHLIYAATILLRADLEQPVLSPPFRIQLRQYVARCVDVAIRIQRPDGYWNPTDWYNEMGEKASPYSWSLEDTTEGRFLVTSHLAEWMLYLPVNMRVPDGKLRMASEWLLARLQEMPIEPTSPVCPRTHAVYVLECLSATDIGKRLLGHAEVIRM